MHLYEQNCKFCICLSQGLANSCTTPHGGIHYFPHGGVHYFELSFVEQLTCLTCLSRCFSNSQKRKNPPAFKSIPNCLLSCVKSMQIKTRQPFRSRVIIVTFVSTVVRVKMFALIEKHFFSRINLHLF